MLFVLGWWWDVVEEKQKKGRQGRKPKSEKEPGLPHPWMIERDLADLGRLLEEREFGSKEELAAFLNGIMALGGVPKAPKRTPLEQAQELVYDAWEAEGEERVALARQALRICPDCADAYVILAEAAETLEEAKELYEQGVRAGERALGPRAFKEDVGYFWGLLSTRPYMRARAGLAECLWHLGKRKEAIAHYQDMLRLNPNDNQGIRYILIQRLLAEWENEAAEELLSRYPDDPTAWWAYSRALLTFRREGASPNANAALEEAIRGNPHVVPYLLGKKRFSKELPAYISIGDETEAVSYAVDAIEAWRKTPGALAWLAKRWPKGSGRAMAGPKQC